MAGGEIPFSDFVNHTSDDNQPGSIIDRVVSARLIDALNLSADDEPSGDSNEAE